MGTIATVLYGQDIGYCLMYSYMGTRDIEVGTSYVRCFVNTSRESGVEF